MILHAVHIRKSLFVCEDKDTANLLAAAVQGEVIIMDMDDNQLAEDIERNSQTAWGAIRVCAI